MMEFLVEIHVRLPDEMPDARRAELQDAERAHGRELLRTGVIQRIWRIPGTPRNVGVWSARDATELHDRIASLPLHRWMSVRVTALAQHPVEREEGRA